MARSFVGLLNQMAREAARHQRRVEAEQRRALRTHMQALRAAERQRSLDAKEARAQYVELRTAEAAEATEELKRAVLELIEVLPHTLSTNDTISFDSLRNVDAFPSFVPPVELAALPSEPSKDDKPIELIDGGQLLYLLDQCAVKARIIFPQELSVQSVGALSAS